MFVIPSIVNNNTSTQKVFRILKIIYVLKQAKQIINKEYIKIYNSSKFEDDIKNLDKILCSYD